MNQTILPGPRTGRVTVPASKSYAHRFFIAAALSRAPVTIHCRGVCGDICATLSCLQALGADTGKSRRRPMRSLPSSPHGESLHPARRESGATLRFLLPLVGALGINAVFHREGRLPQRPLEPLLAELVRHGMSATADGCDLHCQGQLRSGDYVLPGNVSSQFVSALLLALPLLPGDSTLTLTSAPESAPYIAMTEEVLAAAAISLYRTGSRYRIPGRPALPAPLPSHCGGRLVRRRLFPLRRGHEPGGHCRGWVVPAHPAGRQCLAAPAAADGGGGKSLLRLHHRPEGAAPGHRYRRPAHSRSHSPPERFGRRSGGGSHIQNARRLRYKESDRLQGIAELLNSLGGCLTVDGDGLLIHGVSHLQGGTVDPMGDHRLAMSAALAALSADAPVTVRDADCVSKSYPAFWADFQSLKGEAPCPAPSETPFV